MAFILIKLIILLQTGDKGREEGEKERRREGGGQRRTRYRMEKEEKGGRCR